MYAQTDYSHLCEWIVQLQYKPADAIHFEWSENNSLSESVVVSSHISDFLSFVPQYVVHFQEVCYTLVLCNVP